MPVAKPIAEYPHAQFGTLLMRVAVSRETFRIPTTDKLNAHSLRGLMYAFRRACLRDRAKAIAMGYDPDTMLQVNLRIENGVLILEHKDASPIAAALAGFMRDAGIAPIVSPSDAMLDRLKGIEPDADGGEHHG